MEVIVGSLLDGPARFGEIAAGIPGITEAMLSTRLVELQKAGLVDREVLPGPPIASIYRLTDRGTALRPALMACPACAARAAWSGTRRAAARASP